MTDFDEAAWLAANLDTAASADIRYTMAANFIRRQHGEIEQLRAENSELRRRVGVMGNQTTKEDV